MTIEDELKLLYEIKEETLMLLNNFVCEWHEIATYEKLVNLDKRIKELEGMMNDEC